MTSTTTRVVATLPLVVATVLYGLVTASFLLPVVVFGAALLALALAARIDAPRFVQRSTLLVVALFGALGGAAAITALEPEVKTRPSDLLGRIAVTAILLALTRRFFREAEGGMRPDFALLTVAVVVCGQRHVGHSYLAAVVLFVVAIVLVVRSGDEGVGWAVVEANALRATLAIILLVLLLTTAGMVALPRIAVLTERQFERYVLQGSRVGFTDRIGTSSPYALVESDEIVLRAYGPHVDYLRGRVYDDFDGRNWTNPVIPVARPVVTLTGKGGGRSVTELRGVGAQQKADQGARFFVPLGARQIGTSHGIAQVDAFGIVKPVPEEPPTPISFEAGAPEYPSAAPTETDRRVPEALLLTLEPLAHEWTRDATTPAAKMAALEHHLAGQFHYTLEGIPDVRDKPALVHFLDVTHTGRCELFATALAMLGRTLGVPTRVVGGFRVSEYNALGGYDVVREKNAHAWVEAWVTTDGREPGWRTFDGTPATEANMHRDRRGLASVGDALLALWDRALELLGRAALWQFGVLLGGAVLLLTTVRVLRARRERSRAMSASDAGDRPLPAYARLESALAARGHPRPASEPLERYAERLRTVHEEGAATVVLEYSALRYGGIGDAATVAEKALACARAIEATPTSS